MKQRPCWCPKPVLWELNSFLMQTLSFVPINLHRCWPRERKHSIDSFFSYLVGVSGDCAESSPFQHFGQWSFSSTMSKWDWQLKRWLRALAEITIHKYIRVLSACLYVVLKDNFVCMHVSQVSSSNALSHSRLGYLWDLMTSKTTNSLRPGDNSAKIMTSTRRVTLYCYQTSSKRLFLLPAK